MSIRNSIGVRIVSDGTACGTHVYDCDGKEINGITAISWNIDVNSSFGVAKIEIPLASVDIVGELKDG